MSPGNVEKILVHAPVSGGRNVRRRHHSSTFSVLLFQAWAWMGNAFHPFLRENSSDEGVVAEFQRPNQVPSKYIHHAVFGEHWVEDFEKGSHGCESARGSFMWRGQGFGSNINNLLNAWVYTIAVENWTDMAVVFGSGQMSHVECHQESGGETSFGWDCLFSPMPHLCTFENAENWMDYMVSVHVTKEDREKASKLDQEAVRFHPEEIVESLDSFKAGHFEALAVMARYLWSYMTPWLKRDTEIVTRSPETEVFTESPYLGVHIRRGDKVYMKEAAYHGSEEYLIAAQNYIKTHSQEMSVEDIKGIWVASDDPAAGNEIRAVAPAFFPNVDNSTIFWAAGGVPGGPTVSSVKTRTDKQIYAELVYMFADLHQLTHASLFVGTFSSNIGRLVALLRRKIGKKKKRTTISIDRNGWTPGRRRRKLEYLGH